jgi:DNA-binding NarL/FixJ family response regulator
LTPREREATVNTARDRDILRRKKTGESYGSIALDMNLSRQRIFEIVKRSLTLSQCAGPGVRPKTKELTPREREVALLVERKLSNDEIARKLGIKLGTVKSHVHNILKKCGLTPRSRHSWKKGAATAAARKRIREAQRRRWQRWRAAQK